MAAFGFARCVAVGFVSVGMLAGCAHGLEPDTSSANNEATPESAARIGPAVSIGGDAFRACGLHAWTSSRAIDDLFAYHHPPLSSSIDVGMTALPDGRVILGRGSAIYDPKSDRYERLLVPDDVWPFNSITVLDEGKSALFAGGGVDGAATREAWWLDLSERSYRRIAPMYAPRMHHQAIALPEGRVLVAGGTHEGRAPQPYVEIYDPATDTWTPSDAPHFMRGEDRWSTVVALGGGRRLFAGSAGFSLFDLASGTWSTIALPAGGALRGLVTLEDGRLLLMRTGPSSAIFDPAHDVWTPLVGTPDLGSDQLLVQRLGCGAVIAIGTEKGGESPRAATFDPQSGRWRNIEAPALLAKATSLIALPDGSVMTLGALEDRSAARAFPLRFAPARNP